MEAASLQLDLPDLTATEAFGRRLGALLFAGAVVALDGPLGAGKTQMTRAVAEGLDIPDSRAVSSPTFVLIQEYPARLPIYHFDAYRLTGPGDFHDLGAHEYLDGNGVCIIEWAGRVEECLPAERLHLTLHPTGETTRRLTLRGWGPRHAAVVEALRSD